jgi:Asp-tRNA(Asn)/Glu-tRNA(Gln) amidotransferase A subunit family amidase
VADGETGVLVITETLLDLLTAAGADGAEVRFRWVRREYVQDADDLSKFVGRMDFGLRSDLRKYVSTKFGPWDVGRFVGDHNTTAKRFKSLFDSRHAEAVDTMAQDWSKGESFILPDFHMANRIADKIERDNADAVLVVPEWPHTPWWRRLASGA